MKWIAQPLASEKTAEHLSEVLGVSPVISQLLAQRGIDSYDQAKTFFSA